ncbi:hypothetical protein AMECASPLE_037964 [Ameca splendens]|uniref:Uncharacterized protein n=1 Tax=Ameca splendens TaxID=208324 RepID=A0ABV1AG85_9TELE
MNDEFWTSYFVFPFFLFAHKPFYTNEVYPTVPLRPLLISHLYKGRVNSSNDMVQYLHITSLLYIYFTVLYTLCLFSFPLSIVANRELVCASVQLKEQLSTAT